MIDAAIARTGQGEAVVACDGLSVERGGTSVLNRTSFGLPAASLTLVSGATGSGKSTLALTLCGVIPHLQAAKLSGTVSVAGRDPTRERPSSLFDVMGVLLQDVEQQLLTDWVMEELAFGLESAAVAPARMTDLIEDALRRHSIAHLLERAIETLSAGEQQRVMLAAVTILTPPVLILDEPLALLDRHASRALVQHLRQLADRGQTVVVFEHRRDLLAPQCERQLHLHDGALVESEAPAAQTFAPLPPAQPGEVRLRTEELAAGYGSVPLWSDVSLEVAAGESVVLLGDNGSGKTTLFRTLLGLVPMRAGRAEVAGMDARRTSTARLARATALVLQRPDDQLRYPTVREELAATGASEAAVDGELRALELEPFASKHPHALSLGQKRRLTVAIALVRRPRLLLLDEPSVGQDDTSLMRMLRRLSQYVASGGALLTATHDRRVAGALAHRALTLTDPTPRSLVATTVKEYFS